MYGATLAGALQWAYELPDAKSGCAYAASQNAASSLGATGKSGMEVVQRVTIVQGRDVQPAPSDRPKNAACSMRGAA